MQACLAESKAALQEAARRAAEAEALLQVARDDLAAALAEAAAAREKSEAEGAGKNSAQVLEVCALWFALLPPGAEEPGVMHVCPSVGPSVTVVWL